MSKLTIFIFDTLCVIFSYIWIMLFIHYDNFSSTIIKELALGSIVPITVFCIIFLIFSPHKSILRYTGAHDLFRIVRCSVDAFIIMIVLKLLCSQVTVLKSLLILFPSYGNILAISMVACALLTISRLVARRFFNEYIKYSTPFKKVIIYGAGTSGPIVHTILQRDTATNYEVISFCDDDKTRVGKTINGVKILPTEKVISKEYITNNQIDSIILAMPSISLERRQSICNTILELDTNVDIKMVSHIESWINDNKGNLEDITIEQLLGRDPIILDNSNIKNEVNDKIILVTGAAGSIGSEICRQLIKYHPSHLILLDQAESPLYDLQFELLNNEPYKSAHITIDFIVGNVKDSNKMREIFKRYRPQIIYHAAAYKHVPLMETFPYEAVFVNVFGTKLLADLAIEYNALKFVMISTDKAVNPTNVMGATKRIAEIYTQSRKSNVSFITTRFGNVLGSNGSVIPLFKKQLAQGGPLTVTHRDIIRYFMTIPEACNLVLEASAIGKGGDIFVFDMGQPVPIYDLAHKMIQLANKPNVKIEITGLRPGEKLYEELLANEENTIKTEHPKIMHAKVRNYETSFVDEHFNILYDVMNTCDDFEIVKEMKCIVPEFKSNNSIFQALDNKNN